MKKNFLCIVLLSISLSIYSQTNSNTQNQENDNNAGGIWDYVDEQTAITLDSAKAYTDKAKEDAILQSGTYTDSKVQESICPYLTWDDNGIGIGTHVTGRYKLAVEGAIGAREVTITSKTWADFVFDDNYKLMTLKELENFIQANKHLPGIPTTKEVEENGISVGEMNAKLLQKIEETFLYTIQQQKTINNQQKIIDNQQEINNKQQALIEALQNRVERLENR